MKRSLKEELERIHSISYGKNVILEDNFIDSLLNPVKSIEQKHVSDDPKKADLVNNDPKNFFTNLKNIDHSLEQEEYGSMEWHKEVETIQIALELLGYQLPVHGVDGLFGPETAEAVKKYKTDNNILSESTSPYDGGGNVKIDSKVDPELNTILQSKIDAIASEYGKSFTIVSGYRDPGYNARIGGAGKSEHMNHNAVDIHLSNATKEDTLRFVEISSKNGIGGIGVYGPGSVHIDVGSRRAWGHTHKRASVPSWAESTIQAHEANKIDIGYVSDYDSSTDTSSEQTTKESISLEMVKSMIYKLEAKGVTADQLAKYTDYILTSGTPDMTDLDLSQSADVEKYEKLCDAFIAQRPPNLLNISGRMLAMAAQKAFTRYNKYIPPELALAQLATEGGIGNPNPNSRPIRTNNPYNVGNTEKSSKNMSTVEDGVNRYYDLIARNYLGQGRTAADLLKNFVNKDNNRYAGEETYEKVLNSVARRVNKLSKDMKFSV
jgi:hypothetical protein